MTATELRTLCETIYGKGWQTKLARSLHRGDGKTVNPRTVRRWVSGEVAVPAGVAALLRMMSKLNNKERTAPL